MSQKKEQFNREVSRLRKIVQDNETIQQDVTKNIESVEDELGQVEVLMKGMKSDILQYRYALDGMTEYTNELDIINKYCTAVTRNSKNITKDVLLTDHTVYLDALFDIYQSYEFLTNHTTIRDRIKITELQNNVIKRLVDECTQVLSSLLKSEKVNYTPSESNEVDEEKKEELLEQYFGINPINLVLLKDISSTLRKCGKYNYMNDCRTFMTMFLKRMIRGMIEESKKKFVNKPAIEIMANVYYSMIKYLEIELILTNELFGSDNSQFSKIITDSLSLFISQMKDALNGIRQLILHDISLEPDMNHYISELCSTVNSCSIYINYIGKYEERYQALFHIAGENSINNEWNSLISEVQSDCGQLMKLVLEMLGQNTSSMNNQATVNPLSTSIINYLRSINKYSDKLNQLALYDFTSQYPVITADCTLNRYQQYAASVLMALREYLIRSSQTSTDILKNHLYLMNNYILIKEASETGSISAGSFIPSFFAHLQEEEFTTYMNLSWYFLLELTQNPITPTFVSNKAIRPEDRKYIKDFFSKWNMVYNQLVPSMFYCETTHGMKEAILDVVKEVADEYSKTYQHYSKYPFSLHHTSHYLLHTPDDLKQDISRLFSQWNVC